MLFIVANGICYQRTLFIELLKKTQNTCVLALQNGHAVIVEQWDIHNEPLRVSCECYINENSRFAQFL